MTARRSLVHHAKAKICKAYFITQRQRYAKITLSRKGKDMQRLLYHAKAKRCKAYFITQRQRDAKLTLSRKGRDMQSLLYHAKAEICKAYLSRKSKDISKISLSRKGIDISSKTDCDQVTLMTYVLVFTPGQLNLFCFMTRRAVILLN